MMISDNPYLRHTRADRVRLGALVPDPNMKSEVNGYLGEALDFICREQLFDRSLWKKFAEQFRIFPDSERGRWRGEYWGKMMRGAAYVYGVTGNQELYSILEETVCDLLAAQESDGRISSYKREAEFKDWDMWCRKYILLGLICFYSICKSEQLKADILQAMKRHADYILAYVGRASEGKLPICKTSPAGSGFVHGAMNSISILEPMVLLHRFTGERRYLDFADYIVNEGAGEFWDSIFDTAFEDKILPYQYTYTKAYEMISCFEGLLEYSFETNNDKCRETAIRFAYRLAESDITVMGSAGTAHEFFNHSSVRQTVHKGTGQETCVSVTWMKMCARMLLVTGDTLFADCFEQTLYNAYLGTLNTHKSDNCAVFSKSFLLPDVKIAPTVLPFDSYTPLLGGSRGTGIGGSLMFGDGTYYGCCACIGSAGIGIAPYLCALGSSDGVAVMMYASGSFKTRTPSGKDVTLKMSGDYPFGDRVRIELALDGSEEFTLALRVPSWSEKTEIFAGGAPIDVCTGVTEIRREWKSGDCVEISFDMRVEALTPTRYENDEIRSKINWQTFEMVPEQEIADEDNFKYIALRRGPIILARESAENTPLGMSVRNDTYVDASSNASYNGVSVIARLGDSDISLKDSASTGKAWNETFFNIWMRTEK